MRKYTLQEQIIAFWSRVVITADDNQCWLWSGRIDKGGYGTFALHRVTLLAHRIAWTYPDYTIPDGMYVLHSCDVRNCCNPKHLFLGTHQDNMADMARKGRANHPIGDKNGMAKLTDTQIIEICQRFAKGDIYKAELGRQYGVSHVRIGQIIKKNNEANRPFLFDLFPEEATS